MRSGQARAGVAAYERVHTLRGTSVPACQAVRVHRRRRGRPVDQCGWCRGKVPKVVFEGGDGEGRWSVRAAVVLVVLGLGAGFEVVEDGGESESLRSEVEPAPFPDTLIAGDPVRCPARSGVPATSGTGRCANTSTWRSADDILQVFPDQCNLFFSGTA